MRVLLLGGLAIGLVFAPCIYADDDKPPAVAAETGGAAGLAPAGTLVPDLTTDRAAVGSLPVDFVRSPDAGGPDGKGRYLVAVNSGYGIQFDATPSRFDGKPSRGQQSLAVIDLDAKGGAAVVQNVYFPSPQSAQVGAVFGDADKDGAANLFVSGGFENKVWRFRFTPGAKEPISPGSPGPDTRVDAPFIDLTPLAAAPASKRYNAGKAAVYPLGLAYADGSLYMANNLGDQLGVALYGDGGKLVLFPVDLREKPDENVYPYGVVVLPDRRENGGGAKKRTFRSGTPPP